MSSDDPFGGKGDRTVLRPTPGRRRPAGAGPPATPGSGTGPASPQPSAAVSSGQISGSGVNPLVAAAGSLLTLASQLRDTTTHHDVPSLMTHVAHEIKNFEANARNDGEAPEAIRAARYALCTLLDEMVLSTPWGVESIWANESLLVRFHKEAFGGEKFFQVLERSMQDPGRNLHLIEFMYICMALGLEGRYRVQSGGQQKLQQILAQTYETIRMHRGDFERELSPHWRGVEDKQLKIAKYVPLWSVAAVAAGILLLVYSAFLYALNADSDPVVGQLAVIGREPVKIDNRAPVRLPVVRMSLETLLAGDIREGFVEVDDRDDRSIVTMWGLFDSGQARVQDNQLAILRRVADALNQFSGPVVISGHTDNVPIRSLRFPSNWILSERRAESANRLLGEVLPADRLRFEGLADSKPLVPNDTAADRAINRRVEITLYPAAQAL